MGTGPKRLRPGVFTTCRRGAWLGLLVALMPLSRAQEPAGPAAGRWQSADAAEVTRLVDGFLGSERTAPPTRLSRALLVPPVTDNDTGTVAGKAFAQCPRGVDRIILLAGGGAGTEALLPQWDSMRTVLGAVDVDAQAIAECGSRPGIAVAATATTADQAIASVVPFLQRRLSRPFRIVPLVVGAAVDPALLVGALVPLLNVERTAVVALTPGDFSPAVLESLFSPHDGQSSGSLNALPAHLQAMRGLALEMGWKPVVAAQYATPAGATGISVLLVDDPNRVDLLMEAAKADWDDPVTQSAFADAGRAAGRTNFQGDLLSEPEREVLLWLARKTLVAKLKGEPLPAPPLYSDTLAGPAGCFVTLNQAGKLRGCVGSILPKDPLATTVQRNAVAAALEDKRFQPLTSEELPDVEIAISVLTPLRKLEYRDGQDLLDQLKPGIHGVLLTYENSKRATFLPQVWAQAPNKAAFLGALCRRAAAPVDAWQDPSKTTVEVYESFDFAEKAPR